MPSIVATKERSLALADRLAEEEARLDRALQDLSKPYAEARLAAYRIRTEQLWKAAVDERGVPLYNTVQDYFLDRWANRLSRTLFFAYASTLARLQWLGINPTKAIEDSPSHDFDHSCLVTLGKWDYKEQALEEPDPGLLRLLQPGETVQEGARRIYQETKEAAHEHGTGEALRSLELALGKPEINFYKDSADGSPLVLRVEMAQYRNETRDGHDDPKLVIEKFLLCADRPLPREVERLLKKRLWFKE